MYDLHSQSAGIGTLCGTGHGVYRTAYNNKVGEWGVYHRHDSTNQYSPPFTWRGLIKARSVMNPPLHETTGQKAWYDPSLVFHYQYGTSATSVDGNDENTFFKVTPEGKVSSAVELRQEEPLNTPYKVRTGYEIRTKGQVDPPFDSRWHEFRIDVLTHGHAQFFWDSNFVAEVKEREPFSIRDGLVKVALRLDFCDVEIAHHQVTPLGYESIPTNNWVINPVRLVDTRKFPRRRIKPKLWHSFRVPPYLVPTDAVALSATITAVRPLVGGHISVGRSSTSSLNYSLGSVVANTVTIPLNGNHHFELYSSASTHLLVDITGYMTHAV